MKYISLFFILISFTTWSSGKVPDPGEEGKKTVAGIDSDNDGVRDDIQIWINSSYPLHTYPSINQGLKQFSRSAQVALANYQDKQKSIQGNLDAKEAISCLAWIADIDLTTFLVREHQARFINTIGRIEADAIKSGHFHGQSRPDSIVNTPLDQRNKLCKFEAKKESLK